MRLKKNEIEAIKKVAGLIFKKPEIYLFGSRINDNLKGGDIDLYIKLSYKPNLTDDIKFLAKLKRIIGERKIDLVIDYPQRQKELIDEIVKKEGIRLE